MTCFMEKRPEGCTSVARVPVTNSNCPPNATRDGASGTRRSIAAPPAGQNSRDDDNNNNNKTRAQIMVVASKTPCLLFCPAVNSVKVNY